MSAFQTAVDIGQRALQHCGQTRMDSVLGFDDPQSRGASEIAACYDKLREAELEANYWTCAIRRTVLRAIDSNTMLLAPALWAPGVTYFVGSVVADQSGNLWISRIPNNIANDPLLTTYWEPYFGPLAVPLHVASTVYYPGELVYTAPGNGTYRVYMSLQDSNSDVPGTATAYSATAVYFKNQVVTYLSVAYMSLIDLNTGNTPSSAPALWNAATTYGAAATATGSDGIIYTSIAGGNLNHDPTLDGGIHWSSAGVLCPWTTVFVGGAGSAKWLEIGGAEFPAGVALIKLNVIYALGGPSSVLSGSSRSAFKLPSGFLRIAPQNPKGTTPWLGAPSGYTYNDWNFENGFIVSSETGPISLRFVANVTDVRLMHAMFCEGLAARIGMAICDTVTQSASQFQMVAKVYSKWISDAKTQNAIEQGYEDPPIDDYISCRL
jgi:hypothetical protein